jgi:hypothetical protein
MYVLNKEAGGNFAHISFHKDGTFHYKVADPAGGRGGKVIAKWEMPKPMDDSGLIRLACIVIPHRALVLPGNFNGTEDDTVLLPPPAEGQAVEVDIFAEPGPVTKHQWPGQTGEQAARLVGRFSMYTDENPDEGFLHFTAVWTVRPEGTVPQHFAEASLTVPEGTDPPESPRVVIFQEVQVDGQHLPVLTEMPIGHMRKPVSDSS